MGVVADLAALQALADEARPESPPESTASGRAFQHPGVLVTRAQLDFVKKNIARGAEPWASAFLRAKADQHGSPTYAPHPPLANAATDDDAGHGGRHRPVRLVLRSGCPLLGRERGRHRRVHAGAPLVPERRRKVRAKRDRHSRRLVDPRRTTSSSTPALQAGWMGTMFARAAEIMADVPTLGTAERRELQEDDAARVRPPAALRDAGHRFSLSTRAAGRTGTGFSASRTR